MPRMENQLENKKDNYTETLVVSQPLSLWPHISQNQHDLFQGSFSLMSIDLAMFGHIRRTRILRNAHEV